MAKWEEIKVGIRSAANKVLCRTDEPAEEASLTLKKKTAEAHLAEAYEKLGRATYRVISGNNGDTAVLCSDASVASCIDEIEKRKKEVRRLKAAILRLKSRGSDTEQPSAEGKCNEPGESNGETPASESSEKNV